tara:strand:- start:14414 stop:15004 length:591 start_codon:yes stop_codon:yes gene_type:complete
MRPKLDHYIGVYDNAVDESFCQEIISKFENINKNSWVSSSEGSEQFKNSELGRKDTSLFFEQVAADYSSKINSIIGSCMKNYMDEYIGLKNDRLISVTCKVQKTGPSGGYHVWHSEHSGDLSAMRRVAVWVLYLSTHEGEGETEFLQQGIRVAPQAGRVVIWPASFTHPHRGNPVYEGEKYIATGWFEHYWDINYA